MCNQQFINEQWPGIKDALVAKMLENLDWFNQEYEWDEETESTTTGSFAACSQGLRNQTNIIANDRTIDIDTCLQTFYENPNCDEASFITNLRNFIIQILVRWGQTYRRKVRGGENELYSQMTAERQYETDGIWRSYLETTERNTGLQQRIDPWINYIVDFRRNYPAIDTDQHLRNLDFIRTLNSKGIASWSKILAALEPGKMFIYDSRVANALHSFSQAINLPGNRQNLDFWNIPNPQQDGRGNNAAHRRPYPVCYYCYLELLRDLAGEERIQTAYGELPRDIIDTYEEAGFSTNQAIMAHIEKMLFMKGA